MSGWVWMTLRINSEEVHNLRWKVIYLVFNKSFCKLGTHQEEILEKLMTRELSLVQQDHQEKLRSWNTHSKIFSVGNGQFSAIMQATQEIPYKMLSVPMLNLVQKEQTGMNGGKSQKECMGSVSILHLMRQDSVSLGHLPQKIREAKTP